jgi:hypothetical protein
MLAESERRMKGLLTVLVLGGLVMGRPGMAGAQCSQDDRFATERDRCELAFALAETRCDDWSAGLAEGALESSGMSPEAYDRQLGMMYDACVRLSVPLECTGLPGSVQYDLDDGAFWR